MQLRTKQVFIFFVICQCLLLMNIMQLFGDAENGMRERLIIREFRNETDMEEYDWVASSFEDEVKRRLQATGEILVVDPLYAEPDEDFAGAREIDGFISIGEDNKLIFNIGLLSGVEHDTYVTHIEKQTDVDHVFDAQDEVIEESMEDFNFTPGDVVQLAMNNLDVRLEVSATFAPAYLPPDQRVNIAIIPFRSITTDSESMDRASEIYQTILKSISEYGCIQLVGQQNISTINPNAIADYSTPENLLSQLSNQYELDFIIIGFCEFIGSQLRTTIQIFDASSNNYRYDLSFSVNGSIDDLDGFIKDLNRGISLSIGTFIANSN